MSASSAFLFGLLALQLRSFAHALLAVLIVSHSTSLIELADA